MLLDTVKHTIKRHNLITAGETILAGVSGGPDSVTLLLLLHNLRKEFRIKLHIAHLDHMLRTDSRRDAVFVRELGEKLGIPVTCGRLNVKTLRGSVEEAARNARLAFFFKLAKKTGIRTIALGHNLDDQAETVLMRVIRGTGLHGLAGIIPKREISGYTIIRPLLEVKRKEIEAYLRRKKIIPRFDASNNDEIFFRNKIRGELIPLLERRYNKNIKQALANLGESAGYDYDYLASLAAGGTRSISLADLRAAHPALRRLRIRKAIEHAQGDTRRITCKHIRELEDLILNRPRGSIVNLPKGTAAKKTASSFVLYRRSAATL